MTAWLRRLRQNFDSLSPAARLVSVLVLLLIFLMAARTPLDPDMWWHLRAGQETWENAAPYTVDTLSYTRAGAVWVNHSWLGQLSLYLSYRWGGFFGVSLWVAALAVLSMAVLLMQMDGPHGLRAAMLSTGGLYLGYTLTFVQQQARYLFTALPALAPTGALGLNRLAEKRLAVVTAILLLVLLIGVGLLGALLGDVPYGALILIAVAAGSVLAAGLIPDRYVPLLGGAVLVGLVALDFLCLFGFIVPLLD